MVSVPGAARKRKFQNVRGSVRFAGFIVHACLICNPVYFPSLASIIRERLLEMGGIRGRFRPDKPNKDLSLIHI